MEEQKEEQKVELKEELKEELEEELKEPNNNNNNNNIHSNNYGGHVFITLGDLRMFSCDAILIPSARASDAPIFFNHLWFKPYFTAHKMTESPLRSYKSKTYPRVARVTPYDEEWPTPYLVSVLTFNEVGNDMGPVKFLCEGVIQFLELFMKEDFKKLKYAPKGRNGRDRPLVGVPVVGTGGAGQSKKSGLIIHHLLATMCELVQEYRVDINLVTFDLPTFNIAQTIRIRNRWEENKKWFKSMSIKNDKRRIKTLTKSAKKLAKKAKNGKLVLFIGAGVSVGAGLPSWGGLLDELAKYCSIDPQNLQWKSLDHLNKAELIQLRLKEKGERIGDHLNKFLDKPHHSLMHSLLAALPSNQIVTTNYDVLFELFFFNLIHHYYLYLFYRCSL